jgi:hypothetical protein
VYIHSIIAISIRFFADSDIETPPLTQFLYWKSCRMLNELLNGFQRLSIIMSAEERSESSESIANPVGLMQQLYDYWMSLEQGWKAMCLSTVFVLAVSAGALIPW